MQAKEYEKALKVRSRGYVQIARGFFRHLLAPDALRRLDSCNAVLLAHFHLHSLLHMKIPAPYPVQPS